MIVFRRDALAKMAAHRPLGYEADVLRLSSDLGNGKLGISEEDYEALKLRYRGVASGGVGTQLKVLLSKIGIQATPSCRCSARARAMDLRGIGWCRDNSEQIVTWLEEEAAARGLPFLRSAGRGLLWLAIKRAMISKGDLTWRDSQIRH